MAENKLQETLRNLRREYRTGLPEELKRIDSAWQQLQWGWNLDLLRQLYMQVHTVTGNSASFGFTAVGEAARAVEALLLDWKQRATPPDEAELRQFQQGIGVLKQTAERELNRHDDAETGVGATMDAAGQSPLAEAPRKLYLNECADSHLAAYFNAQIDPIEANWQALQWEWHADTMRLLSQQLELLLRNADRFGLTDLAILSQSLAQDARGLSQFETSPNNPKLMLVSQQLPMLRAAVSLYARQQQTQEDRFKPQHELIMPDDTSADEVETEAVFYIHAADHNLEVYLGHQAERVEAAWRALHWEWTPRLLQRLNNQLEGFRKNLDGLGFRHALARVLELLRLLEPYQRSGKNPDSTQLHQLNTLLEQLKPAVQQSDANGEADHKLVYLVDDDKILAQLMAAQLEARGFEVKVFNTVSRLGAAVNQRPPAVLLMDIVLTEGELAGPQVMFKLQKNRSRPLPVIFMSSRTDMKARLAAVKAKGNAYFTKPVDMDSLCAKILDLDANGHSPTARVLLLDNSGNQPAQSYLKVLREEGMQVQWLGEPGRFLEALEKFEPHLVLLNAQLKNFSAVELAQVVRQEGSYTRLPIIFYNQPFEQTWRGAVSQGVSDDFLAVGIPPQQLLAIVTHWLRKTATCAKTA